MSEPTQVAHPMTTEDYVQQAQTSAAALANEIQHLHEANQAMAEGRANPWVFGAPFSFASALIYIVVQSNPYLEFTNGVRLDFNGRAWGAGVGGGISAGAGSMFVNPETLDGADVGFSIGVAFGGCNITWERNGAIIGTWFGAGLNVGTPIVGGGAGRFTRR